MPITVCLSLIMILCLGAALLQTVDALFVRERKYYRRNFGRDRLLVGFASLFLYAIVIGFVLLLYVFSGGHPAVIYFSMVIPVIAAICATARYCWRHWERIDHRSAILLLLWCAAILFLTLFSRIGSASVSKVWNVPFHSFTNALQKGSWTYLGDFFRNVLLFLPIGFLIPCIDPEHMNKTGFSVLGGLMLSTVIEGVQFVTGLGFCDIDDILANSLGAVMGYLLWLVLRLIQKNWRI